MWALITPVLSLCNLTSKPLFYKWTKIINTQSNINKILPHKYRFPNSLKQSHLSNSLVDKLIQSVICLKVKEEVLCVCSPESICAVDTGQHCTDTLHSLHIDKAFPHTGEAKILTTFLLWSKNGKNCQCMKKIATSASFFHVFETSCRVYLNPPLCAIYNKHLMVPSY